MLEVQPSETSLVGAAIAIGSICGMISVFVFFPFIDRFIRIRFALERGQALLLLLILCLGTGLLGGIIGHAILAAREAENTPGEEISGLREGNTPVGLPGVIFVATAKNSLTIKFHGKLIVEENIFHAFSNQISN